MQSHQDQIVALAKILNDAGVKVSIHAFLDGRDTPPQSAANYIKQFSGKIDSLDLVSIATVAGRFYAMDRDNRWDRIAKAYRVIVSAEGDSVTDPLTLIKTSYNQNVSDEFILPTVIEGYDGMKDGDAVLMGNFRADRVRQILSALLDPMFNGFERSKPIAINCATGLVEYSQALNKFMEPIFFPES